MKTVKVADLVGRDITGRQAIVVQPHHDSLYKREGLPRETLIKAEWQTKRDGRWLYLYFEKHALSCGYSGWREDTTETPVVRFI